MYIKHRKSFTTETPVKKRVRKYKHKILLIHEGPGYGWIYIYRDRTRAASPGMYPKLSDASKSARFFRDLLAEENVEIIPPKNHQYSGD